METATDIQTKGDPRTEEALQTGAAPANQKENAMAVATRGRKMTVVIRERRRSGKEGAGSWQSSVGSLQ